MPRPSLVRAAAGAIAAAVLVAGPPRAGASITPEAKSIVDRYIEATGGRAKFERERSTRVKGHINTIGLRGAFQQWTRVPDKLVSRTSLGGVKIVEGYDGVTAWRTDLSSKRVTILDGKDLERMKSDAYFENVMWARDDQGGGAVVAGSRSFRSGDRLESIEVRPPVGGSRKLWFSTKTGFLTRVVTRSDNDESDTWLSDYRVWAGRKRPRVQGAADEALKIQWDPHDPADREQAIVDSVWVNADDDTTRFSPQRSRGAAIAWGKRKGIARIPFRYGSRHVWVRASINGAPPADFILDTGASMTVIDRKYAEEIGLGKEGMMMVQGMGGLGDASFSAVSTVRLTAPSGDAIMVRDLKIGLTDLADDSEPVLWRRMCGLIGFDVLSRFVVEFDYDKHVVTFRDPKGFAYAGKGEPLDMQLMSGVPIVTVALDSVCSGKFLVDVGNSFGVIVHGSLVRKCQIFDAVHGRKQVEMYGGGVGDYFMSWLTRIDKLELGPFEVREPIAGLTLRTRGMVGSSDYAGNIGCGVLERFICTFDYERRKLYLEPGKKFGERDRYSRCGTMFARLKSKVVAYGILHGSPADEAGLKPDDEVTAIDGRSILSYTPEEMDRLFVNGEAGSEHTLSIVRDGKAKRLTLKLQDVL